MGTSSQICSYSLCFYWRTCGSRSKMAQTDKTKLDCSYWKSAKHWTLEVMWYSVGIHSIFVALQSYSLYFPCPSKMIFSINHVWTDCYDFYLPYIKQFLPVTSKSVCSDINMLIWLFMSKYTLTVSYNVKAIGSYAFFDEIWQCEATWDTATVGESTGSKWQKNYIWYKLMFLNKWEQFRPCI